MPSKGISLHIGLNFVDPDHYGGWDGELKACEFDARDMQAIAEAQGFKASSLITRDATADTVIAAIEAAAKQLKAGDIFLLTYSGHGGQVPDTNADEKDEGRQDETWLLCDRQLIDDELWNLWKRFKRGVRIFMLSDSCHSGTVSRLPPAFPASGPIPRIRLLPPRQAEKVYRRNKDLYDGIQRSVPAGERVRVNATVLLISGCQDNQYSLDGAKNGLFTGTLRRIWDDGGFEGGYVTFRDSIARKMPSNQTPNYSVVGRSNAKFESQKPFTI